MSRDSGGYPLRSLAVGSLPVSPTALIVDYGGVLTSPLSGTVDAWLAAERIEPDRFRAVMREWFGLEAAHNIAHDLETGRITPADFQPRYAEALRRADGSVPEAEGLLERMFAGFQTEHRMLDVLRSARRHGLRTALLSNSWGFDYPRDGWDGLFDAVVISGEVGMRKPEAEIYVHTAGALGVAPADCVFVDDLGPNVRAAVAIGMIGIRHVDVDTTIEELEAIFAKPFR
ncbi:MAG: HAD family phosphatase [Geodermatophilaceae bacterium]|nr:HAD family phosphatase [Geodermatophilaceae bacterium]